MRSCLFGRDACSAAQEFRGPFLSTLTLQPFGDTLYLVGYVSPSHHMVGTSGFTWALSSQLVGTRFTLRPVLTNKNKPRRRNLFLNTEVCPMQFTGHELRLSPEGSSGMPISDPKAKVRVRHSLCEILLPQDCLMEQAGLQAVSTLRHPGGSPDVSAHIAEEMKLRLGIH